MLPATWYGEQAALHMKLDSRVCRRRRSRPGQGGGLRKPRSAQVGIDSDDYGYLDDPLSSRDPRSRGKSLAGMRTSLHKRQVWGSDVVLLGDGGARYRTFVIAMLGSGRTQEIRKLLPLAEELRW